MWKYFVKEFCDENTRKKLSHILRIGFINMKDGTSIMKKNHNKGTETTINPPLKGRTVSGFSRNTKKMTTQMIMKRNIPKHSRYP